MLMLRQDTMIYESRQAICERLMLPSEAEKNKLYISNASPDFYWHI